MPPVTREAQRAELHKTVLRIVNGVPGRVDGWDFKSYVLGLLFYRFISENLAAYINSGDVSAGEQDFDYGRLSDAQVDFDLQVRVVAIGSNPPYSTELNAEIARIIERQAELRTSIDAVVADLEGGKV